MSKLHVKNVLVLGAGKVGSTVAEDRKSVV